MALWLWELMCADAGCRAAGGRAKGLPSGISVEQLVAEHVPAIPGTHDEGNPNMTSEFFDTRQACGCLCGALGFS